MVKKLVVLTLLIILALLLGWEEMHMRLIIKKPVVNSETIFEINKGDSFDAISKQLLTQQIAIDPFWLKLYAYRQNIAQHLKAGEYELSKGLTCAEILGLFVEGKTRRYAITFPEGWSFKQVFQVVKDNPNLHHTLADAEYKSLLVYIGSDKNYPEGLFFPDTYFFEKHTTDVELLKRAHDKMRNVLNEEWQKRDRELPLETPYQALILASIIEKETAAVEERKQIAGVFTRRLKKGMLLQTDPTVIYGMGDDYHGDIHYKDLKQPTPYNTYINGGLPPTPIAMPGKDSIVAALHPDSGNALYFVSSGNGHHVFSSTLVEHEKYVDRYQK